MPGGLHGFAPVLGFPRCSLWGGGGAQGLLLFDFWILPLRKGMVNGNGEIPAMRNQGSFIFVLLDVRLVAVGWGKVVTCVSRRNCSGLITRLGRVRAVRHPTTSTTVTRTHSGNSLDRGTRCSTTGRRRTVLRNGVDRLGTVVDSTGVVSASGLGASIIRVLSGIRVHGMGGGVGVGCAVMSRARTGLGRKGVSMRAPVTRKLLNGGINSITRVGVPRKAVRLRVIGVSFRWS